MSSADISLIDEICSSDQGVVVRALQAAAPLRETLAPSLLARLTQAAVEPDLWTGEHARSPVFLPYLAAAWRLTEAHALIVALLRLPPKQCDAMLGDFITEGARLTLTDTCPGDLRAIRALALDGNAEPYARGAAVDAAALLAVHGMIARETVLALLIECAALPLDASHDDHCSFVSQLVSTILDLRAWELRGTVTSLFERELVDPSFCGYLDEVLDELEPGATIAPADVYRFPPPITDAWTAVRGWCFFDDLHPGRDREQLRKLDRLEASLPEAQQETALRADPAPFQRATPKVGRNDPCPCGRGKKFKKCCDA